MSCRNCGVAIEWGVLCIDCVRAVLIGILSSGAGAFMAWVMK